MLRKLVVVFSSLFVCMLVLLSIPLSQGAQALTPTPKPYANPPATVPKATATSVIDNIPTAAPTSVVTAVPTDIPAPVQDRQYPETGFTVPGVFVKFWDANGGLPVFGYPISAAHTETSHSDGKEYLVQYFERNRFEYHPEFKDTPNEVLLGLLGVELNKARTFNPVDTFQNTDSKVYVDATKHSLAEPFLGYWKTHGGLAVFGYPISEPLNEKNDLDGKTYLVQYFQRNRFEYHPENNPPYDVLLGLLGRDAMEMQSLYTAWGTPVPGGLPTTEPVWKPAKPAVGGQFLKGPTVGDGMNVQMYWQDQERILNMMNDLSFGWITQQVEWKETEDPKGAFTWTELDRVVDNARKHNVQVMISVVKAPKWATQTDNNGFPKNPQDLQDFMKAMATHFKGRVGAYMIWNEQNLWGEAGDINPGRYVELLKAGYLGVKAADPAAIVLSGALAPTGINDPEGKRGPGEVPALSDTRYLEMMYQYNNGEMRQYCDVIGTHPYGFNNPPEMKWPDNPNMNPLFPKNKDGNIDFYNRSNSFYFRRIEDQRAIMEKYGDGEKQMWVTEYGWCSDQRPEGYGECLYNSPDQQGDYMIRAQKFARRYYPWMGVMFVWNLNFSTFQEWYTGPSHYAILNGDWSPRPAYYMLKYRQK